MYMKQTGDLTSAMHLVKAEALTTTAASLQSEALKTGSQQAVAIANQHVGALQQRGVQEIQQGTEGQYRIKSLQMNQQMQRLQMDAMGALYGGAASGQMGTRMSPGQLMVLPKDITNTLVQVAPGQYRKSMTEKAQEKAQEALQKADQMESATAELADIAKRHPAGTWGREENAKAKALGNYLQVGLFGSTEDQRRFTETERKLGEQIVSDPTSFWQSVSGGNTGKLEALKNMLWTHRASTLNNYTIGTKISLHRPGNGFGG